jgi:GT2 family glycosyltransferase
VAFLDSDVVPQRDFVSKAFAALASQPDAVAAFGSYDDSPAARGVISRYRNLLHHFTHQHANRDAQTFWAACGICDAEVFRSEGGYDERYALPSIEDIEFGYRLRRAGHRIALDPSWQIKHLKKWTWRDLVFTDIGRRAIPWTTTSTSTPAPAACLLLFRRRHWIRGGWVMFLFRSQKSERGWFF